ncbi:hypothetical protein EYF80_024485 [Liparis tanakae]|uniref:Uncharacterized protein n=1 Tax=Liparis tanakae TaxID=230148 RepID=A0A4Z2HIG7_9TELE|nr:hypothetical protein EYF80_024485 [Liparis tanakae]
MNTKSSLVFVDISVGSSTARLRHLVRVVGSLESSEMQRKGSGRGAMLEVVKHNKCGRKEEQEEEEEVYRGDQHHGVSFHPHPPTSTTLPPTPIPGTICIHIRPPRVMAADPRRSGGLSPVLATNQAKFWAHFLPGAALTLLMSNSKWRWQRCHSSHDSPVRFSSGKAGSLSHREMNNRTNNNNNNNNRTDPPLRRNRAPAGPSTPASDPPSGPRLSRADPSI